MPFFQGFLFPDESIQFHKRTQSSLGKKPDEDCTSTRFYEKILWFYVDKRRV